MLTTFTARVVHASSWQVAEAATLSSGPATPACRQWGAHGRGEVQVAWLSQRALAAWLGTSRAGNANAATRTQQLLLPAACRRAQPRKRSMRGTCRGGRPPTSVRA